MKKEIKFKVWCKGTSENANFNKPHWRTTRDFILNKYFYCIDDVAESDDFVLCQFSGMVDKDGKEIYEGDIIQIDDKDETRVYKVVFEDGYFGLYRGDKFKHALLHPYKNACTVIGNIFENPESRSEERRNNLPWWAGFAQH